VLLWQMALQVRREFSQQFARQFARQAEAAAAVSAARAAAEEAEAPGRNGDDRLEVAGPGAVWSKAAVGQSDPRLGVAVLDAELNSTCLPADFGGPGDGDAGLGVVLYAVVAGASGLAEVAIRGPGQGPSAWFVVAEGGVLPVGTPLFSGRGTLVTLVGAVDSEQPGRSRPTPFA
jgi:hypothetical protein